MKISTKGRYAIRALTHLAKAFEEDKPITIKELSKKEKISNRYLENIFVKLRKAGIVKSYKGEKGGFFLTGAPDTITMYDILRAVENLMEPSECIIDKKFCNRFKKCGMRRIWIKFNEHIDKFLKNINLKEITLDYLGEKND